MAGTGTENFYLLNTLDEESSEQIIAKSERLGVDRGQLREAIADCESYSQVYEWLVEANQVDPVIAYQAMMDVLGLSDDETIIGKSLHRLLDEYFKPCGLNADWAVSAWHISPGVANTKSGDFYITDDECRKFSLVRRWLDGEENDETQNFMSVDMDGLNESECVDSLKILIGTARSVASIWEKKR